MTPDDVQSIELLVMGWCLGILTAILYASIAHYRQIKARNRRHQVLLDFGVDPLTILKRDP